MSSNDELSSDTSSSCDVESLQLAVEGEGSLNRQFPSSLVPLFQSESKCETILMKMTCLHEKETACRTHFHMKGLALRLALEQRHKRTQKWPIRSFSAIESCRGRRRRDGGRRRPRRWYTLCDLRISIQKQGNSLKLVNYKSAMPFM